MSDSANTLRINKNLQENLDISCIKLQKMGFLYNALENGWTIKKQADYYIFTKNHEGKKEVYLDTYLHTFMKENFNINKIIN